MVSTPLLLHPAICVVLVSQLGHANYRVRSTADAKIGARLKITNDRALLVALDAAKSSGDLELSLRADRLLRRYRYRPWRYLLVFMKENAPVLQMQDKLDALGCTFLFCHAPEGVRIGANGAWPVKSVLACETNQHFNHRTLVKIQKLQGVFVVEPTNNAGAIAYKRLMEIAKEKP